MGILTAPEGHGSGDGGERHGEAGVLGGLVVQDHAKGGAHETEGEDEEDRAHCGEAGGSDGDGEEVVVCEDTVGDGVTRLRGQRESHDKLQAYPIKAYFQMP